MGAYEHYLAHYGVPGMKWGVRRYQNADGTRTAAGAARYGSQSIAPEPRKLPWYIRDEYRPASPPKGAIVERPEHDTRETMERPRMSNSLTIGQQLNMLLSNAISNRNKKKAAEKERIKETAKEYSDVMEKAKNTKVSEAAVSYYEQAQKLYDQLGNTKWSRVRNAIKYT